MLKLNEKSDPSSEITTISAVTGFMEISMGLNSQTADAKTLSAFSIHAIEEFINGPWIQISLLKGKYQCNYQIFWWQNKINEIFVEGSIPTLFHQWVHCQVECCIINTDRNFYNQCTLLKSFFLDTLFTIALENLEHRREFNSHVLGVTIKMPSSGTFFYKWQ